MTLLTTFWQKVLFFRSIGLRLRPGPCWTRESSAGRPQDNGVSRFFSVPHSFIPIGFLDEFPNTRPVVDRLKTHVFQLRSEAGESFVIYRSRATRHSGHGETVCRDRVLTAFSSRNYNRKPFFLKKTTFSLPANVPISRVRPLRNLFCRSHSANDCP